MSALVNVALAVAFATMVVITFQQIHISTTKAVYGWPIQRDAIVTAYSMTSTTTTASMDARPPRLVKVEMGQVPPEQQYPETPPPTRTAESSTIVATSMPSAGNRPIVIAYAISVTQCPDKDPKKLHGLIDSAAVLAHSIHLKSRQTPGSASSFDYRLYAFVHPQAESCTEELERLNYTRQIRETPIRVSDIRKKVYRDRVVHPSAGCCGEKEFLKLYSLTLMEHPVVVHFDLDALLLRPLDVLFHAMLQSQSLASPQQQQQRDPPSIRANTTISDTTTTELSSVSIPYAMWPEDRNRNTSIETFFTRDYPMGNPGFEIRHFGMQGGFWVVKPNLQTYEEFRSLILEGNFSGGWYDGTTHYKGFYGAAMIQGLVGYYYSHLYPERAVELNRCYFNQMVDNPKFQGRCFTSKREGQNDCQDCRQANFSEIYSFHATFCGKPWFCPRPGTWKPEKERLCAQLHQQWHDTRYHLEQTWMQQGHPQPNASETEVSQQKRFKRPTLPLPQDTYYGHCQGGRYRPLRIPK